MYKKYTYSTDSGTEALKKALKILESKIVIIPTYTCQDVLKAVLGTPGRPDPLIVDCNKNLQIDMSSVLRVAHLADTIIIPHMFGIQNQVAPFKDLNLKIIEDLSQCHGLPELGKYADIVVSSTNKSKWLDNGGGGYLFSDQKLDLPQVDFNWDIETKYTNRKAKAQKLLNEGHELIGKDIPNSWLRGMYFTDTPTRTPYIPLHEIYGFRPSKLVYFTKGVKPPKVECPIVDSYSDKLDWISIFD